MCTYFILKNLDMRYTKMRYSQTPKKNFWAFSPCRRLNFLRGGKLKKKREVLQNNGISTDYYRSHKLVIFAVSSSALLSAFYLRRCRFRLSHFLFSVATGVTCYHHWSRFLLLPVSLFVFTSIFLSSGHSCSP